ncbi:hypothetical protein CAEBREN_31169 [Caenorhabditis brenneri]|uniref:Serpentine Receptor, class BC (Class B-like) n=1 Tax=Caenorhabditis brenneri TaxID=135651 RepID=G0NES1_CAEBE|nr:hypothetical protein CAEBREN_31169 [Caenorhabditis brenneri]
MTLMNISSIIITIIGVFASVFTIFMNIFLLKRHSKNRDDMVIFYCRFAIDVFIGIAEIIYLTFIIFYAVFNDFFVNHRTFLVFFGLLVSALGSVRSIVTLAISIERFLAVYFPIFYHNNQNYFSPIIIGISAIGFGFVEPIVLFGICSYDFDVPQQCVAFLCAINQCFFTFMRTHKSVNRLAIIDAAIVFLFDFLPNITRGQVSKNEFFSFQVGHSMFSCSFMLSFQNIGPYGAVSKCVGCAMEAYLVFKTLARKDSAVESKIKMSGEDNRPYGSQ